MEYDVTGLKGTLFGDFLMCALLGATVTDPDKAYNQEALNLEITVDGTSIDLPGEDSPLGDNKSRDSLIARYRGVVDNYAGLQTTINNLRANRSDELRECLNMLEVTLGRLSEPYDMSYPRDRGEDLLKDMLNL